MILAADINHNWLAIRLVKGDVYAKSMVSEASIKSINEDVLNKNQRLNIEIPSGRYKAISHILASTCDSLKVKRHRLTEMVDTVCMNKYLGLPIFPIYYVYDV